MSIFLELKKLRTLKSFKNAFAKRYFSQPSRSVAFLFVSLIAGKDVETMGFPSLHFRFKFSCASPWEEKYERIMHLQRDRKCCNVIQNNISLFKQHFPLFPETENRMHIRLQYCRRCRTDPKENKILWKFHVASQIDVYRVWANKYVFKVRLHESKVKFPSFRLITNSWEIVEDCEQSSFMLSSVIPCQCFESK